MSLWATCSKNWKLTFSFVGSVGWFLILCGMLIFWHDGIVTLVALVGTALGWAAGILLAPYESEEKRFKAISKGVTGIVGGYLLGKFDKVFDLVTDKTAGTPVVLTPTFVRAALVGFGCFLITTILVFVGRTYWQRSQH